MNKDQLIEYYEELIKRGNLKQEEINYLKSEIAKLNDEVIVIPNIIRDKRGGNNDK